MTGRIIVLLIVALFGIFTSSATDRALLVGIGDYDTAKTGWGHIHGDNDVALLRPMLEKRGFTDVMVLTNSQAKKGDIVKALQDMAQRCQPGDRVYFHFSGHGQPIRDDNRDEGHGKKYDESIIPYDACRDTRRLNGTYTGQYHLIDDELNPLLEAINRRLGKGGELFVAVDACFSRGIQKDEMTDIDPELLRYVRGTDFAFSPKGRISVAAPKGFSPGARITIVTACRENERNFEYKIAGKMYGSLSYYIYTLLKSDADFGRWRRCFEEGHYVGARIFQTVQHPSVQVYQ